MEEDFDIEYPFRVFKTKEEVTRHVVARVQIADDLIILQDGRVLRDAVLTFQDEDGSTFYRYYEGVTFAFHDDLSIREEEVIYIYMAWGNWKMVYTNGAEQYINNLTALFKEWQPSLFDRV